MKPVYYGIAVEPEEAGHLAAVMSQQPDGHFVASLTDTDEEPIRALVTSPNVLGRLLSARDLCGALVRSVAPLWPTTEDEAVHYMASAPDTLAGWTLRNLLFQFATGGFMYWANQTTCRTHDLVTHLTVARMFNQTSIAILPSDMRTVLETAMLTLTDHTVGEADARALSLVLRSLNRDTQTSE